MAPIKTTLAQMCLASHRAMRCTSEEQIAEDSSDHIGSVEQAGSTGDSADYRSVTSGWGYRRWSSAGVHKIVCIEAGYNSYYYDSSYQGWSNTSHCSAAARTSWYPTCSGSGVANHNPNHDGSDHWFALAGSAHDAANVHEGSCSYSWWSTCNSKDWVEHMVEYSTNPYYEDGH